MATEEDEINVLKERAKEFHIELLTDLTVLKSLIEDGRDVPAYRNVQKISDKIKTEIRTVQILINPH